MKVIGRTILGVVFLLAIGYICYRVGVAVSAGWDVGPSPWIMDIVIGFMAIFIGFAAASVFVFIAHGIGRHLTRTPEEAAEDKAEAARVNGRFIGTCPPPPSKRPSRED